MLHVAYDITALAQSAHGGIARTCHQTLLQAAAHPEIDPVGFYRHGRAPHDELPGVSFHRLSLVSRLTGPHYDIVHCLCHRLAPLRATKVVYTLHDAWSLHPNRYQSPEFQRRIGRRMRRELAEADLIIAVSESTRRIVLEQEIVKPERCAVLYWGATPLQSTEKSPPSNAVASAIHKPFVLFVGRLEVRKNLPHVLDAVRPLDEVNLVLVGQPGYGYEMGITEAIAAFPEHRRIQLPSVTEPDLAWLYRHAVAALQPSWEEGFGLPVLEAMANGCPVVTADTSATAEIAGHAAILVDPSDAAAGSRAIERLLDDPAFRERQVSAGLARAAEFTWPDHFRRLLEHYRRLLG